MSVSQGTGSQSLSEQHSLGYQEWDCAEEIDKDSNKANTARMGGNDTTKEIISQYAISRLED